MRKTALLALALVCGLQSMGEAMRGWRVLKTDGYTVFYYRGFENEAREALNALEYYRGEVTGLTGDRPRHFSVVIEDVGTLSNGLANPVYGHMRLFPYRLSGQQADENWLSYVAKHELIHMHHFNNIGGIPKGLRAVFGNLFLPNLLSPGWLYEGLAVYGESQGRSQSGRLNNGYYDTYVRAAIAEGRFPDILSATYSPMRYPYGDGIYLYGGTFFRYLADTYGEQRFGEFFTHNGRSVWSLLSPFFPFVGLDRSARAVYGKSYPALWREWREYLTMHHRPYRVEGERLTHRGDFVDDLAFYQDELYFTRSYLEKTGSQTAFLFHQLVRLRDGDEQVVVSTTAPIRGFSLADDHLWYGVQEIASGYANTYNDAYGYQTAVHLKSLHSGRDRQLFKAEMRAFTALPDGTLLYAQDRKDEFGSFIYVYDPAAGESRRQFSTQYIVDRLRTDGGRVFASARQDWENFSVYELELAGGHFRPLVHTPYVEQVTCVAAGRVLFTANYGGEYGLYYVESRDGAVYRYQGEGFVRSAAWTAGGAQLQIAGLHSAGFDIYANVPEFAPYRVPQVAGEAPIPQVLPNLRVREGSYRDNLRTLLPVIHIPMFHLENDSTVVGVYAQGGDAIGHFEYLGPLYYHVEKRKLYTDMWVIGKLFAPWQTALRYSNERDDHGLTLVVGYPLVRRLQPGLSRLSAAVEVERFENFERLAYTPHLSLGLRYPGAMSEWHVKAPIEREKYGSRIDRTGLYGEATVYRYLHKSHLRLAVRGIYDPDHPDQVFPAIRGYADPLEHKKGGVFAADLSILPVRIGKGLWNPNLYFEDLNTRLFVVGAAADQGRSQAAGGVEFAIDGGMFFFVPVQWGVTLAYNRDRERSANFFFGTEMAW